MGETGCRQIAGHGNARTTALVVLAAALTVRLLYFFEFLRSPLWGIFRIDQVYYRTWARELAAGTWKSETAFEQSPLYAYLLGAIYRLVGPRDPLILAGQLLCGLATTWLIFSCARRLYGTRAAAVAGILAAVYGPLIFYECMLMKTFLEPFFIMAALAAGLRHGETGHLRWSAAAGGAVGLACLVRESHLLLVLPLLAALWFPTRVPDPRVAVRMRPIGAALLALGLVLAPSALRNRLAAHDPSLVSSAAGENFYLAFGPTANGYYSCPDFVSSMPYLEHQDFREEAFLRTRRYMTRSAASRYWGAEALRAVRASPRIALRLIGFKAAILFNDFEIPDNENYRATRRFVPLLKLLPTFGWIAGLGLLGFLQTLLLRRGALLPVGFAAALVMEILLTFNTGRYRAGLAAVWLLLAGAGAARLMCWREGTLSRRALRTAPPALLVAAVTVLSFRPPPALAPETARWQEEGFVREVLTAAAARRTALALEKAGRRWPDDPSALLGLGRAYEEAGMLYESIRALERAVQVAPQAAAPRYDLANIFFARGELPKALRHAAAFSALRPQDVQGWVLLGRINTRLATSAARASETHLHLRAATAQLQEAVRRAPDSAAAQTALGRALYLAGNISEAAAHLSRAVALEPSSREAKHLLALLGSSGP